MTSKQTQSRTALAAIPPRMLGAALFALLAAGGPARGQTSPASDPRLRELADHAVELRTIDPENRDFSDLQPLKQILSGRRVVMLGESTHADGATFLAKSRLVEFLHAEMGFDLLAWEGGFCDLHHAWKKIVAGTPVRDALRLGVMPAWLESGQTQELVSYLDQQARTAAPLEIIGIDPSLGTNPQGAAEVRASIAGVIQALNGMTAEPIVPPEALASLDAALTPGDRPPTATETAAALRAVHSAGAALGHPEVSAILGTADAQWWRQCFRGLAAHLETLDLGEWKPGQPMAPSFNPRDAQMGENLIWYATERYPGRKLIVWSATMHAVRRPELASAPKYGLDYRDVVPAGHLAWLALRDELYAVGFTAYEGEYGWPWPRAPRLRLEPAAAGSIEALAKDAGLTSAWIDLSTLPAESGLRQPIAARPLGYLAITAPWPSLLDGVFFHRTMSPSTSRNRE